MFVKDASFVRDAIERFKRKFLDWCETMRFRYYWHSVGNRAPSNVSDVYVYQDEISDVRN